MAAKFFVACLLVTKLTQLADAEGSGNEKASGFLPQNSGTDSQAHSSKAGPSPTPAEVERTVMAIIQISDPLEFDLDRYVEAVKKATGWAVKAVKAAVKGFEISVNYVLPDAMRISEAKAAIAKAINVMESQLQVSHTDIRMMDGTRLALNAVHVNIVVPDKSKAAAVKTSAADVAALESEIDGHVSVALPPVTAAKVETTVTVETESSAINHLVYLIKSARSYADGITIIKTWWHFKEEGTTPAPSLRGASSNVSIFLAVLLILLRAI